MAFLSPDPTESHSHFNETIAPRTSRSIHCLFKSSLLRKRRSINHSLATLRKGGHDVLRREVDRKYRRKVARVEGESCFSPPVGICCLYRRAGKLMRFSLSLFLPRFPAASVYAKAKREKGKKRGRDTAAPFLLACATRASAAEVFDFVVRKFSLDRWWKNW